MITILKTKETHLVDASKNETAIIKMVVEKVVNEGNGLRLIGEYYYEKLVNDISSKFTIKRFEIFKDSTEINTLAGLVTPQGNNYMEQQYHFIQGGAFVIITSEGLWGLTAADWEVEE